MPSRQKSYGELVDVGDESFSSAEGDPFSITTEAFSSADPEQLELPAHAEQLQLPTPTHTAALANTGQVVVVNRILKPQEEDKGESQDNKKSHAKSRRRPRRTADGTRPARKEKEMVMGWKRNPSISKEGKNNPDKKSETRDSGSRQQRQSSCSSIPTAGDTTSEGQRDKSPTTTRRRRKSRRRTRRTVDSTRPARKEEIIMGWERNPSISKEGNNNPDTKSETRDSASRQKQQSSCSPMPSAGDTTSEGQRDESPTTTRRRRKSRRRARRTAESTRPAGKDIIMGWERNPSISKEGKNNPDKKSETQDSGSRQQRQSSCSSIPSAGDTTSEGQREESPTTTRSRWKALTSSKSGRRTRSKSKSARRKRAVKTTSTKPDDETATHRRRTHSRPRDVGDENKASTHRRRAAPKRCQSEGEIEIIWQRNNDLLHQPRRHKQEGEAASLKVASTAKARKPAHLRVYQNKSKVDDPPRKLTTRRTKKAPDETTLVWQRVQTNKPKEGIISQSERVDKLALVEVAKRLGDNKKAEEGKKEALTKLRGRRLPKSLYRSSSTLPKAVDPRGGGDVSRGPFKSTRTTTPDPISKQGEIEFTWRRERATKP
jgi:hypothetical protein